MHPEQLQQFRERLRVLQEELRTIQDLAKAGAQPVELDQTQVGRLSRMDALQAQAMSVASNRRRDIQLQRIESALRRLERDEYGVCTSCGEDIDWNLIQPRFYASDAQLIRKGLSNDNTRCPHHH